MMIKPRRASRRDESEVELETAACSESAGWATPEFQLAGPSHLLATMLGRFCVLAGDYEWFVRDTSRGLRC